MTAFIDIPVGFGVRGSSQGHVHVYGKKRKCDFVFEIKIIREYVCKMSQDAFGQVMEKQMYQIGHNVE